MYLTQLLHKAVQQNPQRSLTAYRDRVRSSAEVLDRVSGLAGGLRGLGVDPGDRVAILAFNSDRYLETLLAAWWLGAVAVPVNSRWAGPEIVRALDDVEPTVIVVGEECRQLLDPDGPGTVVALLDGPAPDGVLGYEELIAAGPRVDDVRAGGDHLALLIFSGGTTGAPKAVMHTHQGVMISMLGSMAFARSSRPDGASLVMAPLFHIAALLGMVAQCLVGGTVVFVDRFDPGEVLGLIEKYRISTLTAIPEMVAALYRHPGFGSRDTSSLACIVYGATPMPGAVLDRARTAFPGVQFVQGYGMTETAVIASLLGADHDAGGARLRSVGRASLHAEIRIVDPDDIEVPRGTVGELVTRGDHLMRGYWKRPDETAQALRGGWMHTGDLAYMDDDGYLYVVDRAKDMIISGGENVYSVEVEDAIAGHPAVARCAVIGVPDPQWGERVHAVVQLVPGRRATANDIRDHASARIARYKAPRTIDFVEDLATTSTGKIDKRAIRGQYR